MIVYFSKNVDDDNPNRWYAHIISRQDYSFNYYWCNLTTWDNNNPLEIIKKKLENNGFSSKHEVLIRECDRKQVLYLEFDNDADEAEFILYISVNNIEL
jgi:hypothetical protein